MSHLSLREIIHDRRAVKKSYTDEVVTKEIILELLEDAVWAPTHKMRQPWRFVFIDQEHKGDFAKKVAATYPEERQNNREAYMNLPNAILAVIIDKGQDEKQYDENFGATACMIQNLWLLAWEKELGMTWKTNLHIYDKSVQDELNVGEDEKLVGLIHLGYFRRMPRVKERLNPEEKFSVYGVE